MKKTNTTMKKIISIMMIIAVLAGLAACGAAEPNGTTNATDSEQMQATGSVATTEGDKPGETTTGQPGDGTTNTSEAAEPSTSADPTTEPSTQPTQPTEPSETQPTTPTQPTQPQPTDPPHQHDYSTTTVVAPTCNDKGYTKHTCACGDSYKDNYTDPVKMVYDAAQAQQVGNNYILSLGYILDESLVWDTHGYYPPEVVTGYALGLVGGQEWLNNRAIENVQDTVNRLVATANPGDDPTNARLLCSVTYNAETDKYWIYVYYG